MLNNDLRYFMRNGYYPYPQFMQIEITNMCPLHCPQCYKVPGQAKHMPVDVYKKVIDDACGIGVEQINLNGGEPLCHPHFPEMVEYAASKGLHVATFISGYLFDEQILKRLAPIKNFLLMVSLNGSTETVNARSRDGYAYAIHTLKLLQAYPVDFLYAINWVARSDNISDLPEVARVARKYGADHVNIVCNKITQKGVVVSPMGCDDYAQLIKIIRDDANIYRVQSCYGLLLAQLSRSKSYSLEGCQAGVRLCGMDVEGRFIPCTHLYRPEKADSILEYWQHSSIMESLRTRTSLHGEHCQTCVMQGQCRFCHALSQGTYDDLLADYSECCLYERREKLGIEHNCSIEI